MMQRCGSVIRLRPECRDEYLSLHANVWPGVEAALTRANIRNYTIFLRDDLLFGYYEYVGDDHPADLGLRWPSCGIWNDSRPSRKRNHARAHVRRGRQG